MANILVMRFSAFGDVAMLVPVVFSTAKAYPDDIFYVLTNKSFIPLFDVGVPNIRGVGIDLKEYRGLGGLFRLRHTFKAYSIDIVADMHDVLRTKYLRKYFLVRGKKVRHIDKGRAEKKAIVAHKIPLHPLKHTIERYRDVFSALGYPSEMQFTSFFADRQESVSLPEALRFDVSRKNIGIAPFAKHREKTYPPQEMEKVVALLSQHPHLTVYLFGGKAEADTLNAWEKKYPNVVSVFGKTTLQTELALISKLNVMVSMDSANMHLASLTGTPVVSIWGATHPDLGFYGFNQSRENAVQVELACRPCSVFGDKSCHRGDWACMEKIDYREIYDNVMRFVR